MLYLKKNLPSGDFTKVKIFKEDKELPTPEYAKKGDAGVDLYSSESRILKPGEYKLIMTGIRLAIPFGYEAQVRPRSGMAANHGISIVNTPGTIDAGYRGQIMVALINHGKENYEIKRGDRIAQMIFKKVEYAEFEEVDNLDLSTERGEGGYGHTGK